MSPEAAAMTQASAGDDPDGVGLPLRFGKYTLLRKLATGGMAELFLAIQRSVAGFEKLIVIKRILPAMNQDRAFIDMLLHEARVAATLSHPNIVQVFDVGHVDGAYFIAMEHVHGEDLRSIVRQMKRKGVREFPLEHAIAIVIGMCAALSYAHDKRDLDNTKLNIVHRDISPQNVVVAFTGDVKIVDFGIAKSDVNSGRETMSGKLKGKVPYMSPEQARGEDVDWRSDIFAAGVMLFELTTGKRLFKGPSEYETLRLICDRDYPTPSAVRPDYSPELEAIVVRALAKDRTKRFQNAREMHVALEEFARNERIPLSTIALSEFMQGLFEDKLASQKEALLQGKHLADIIELNAERESMNGIELGLRTHMGLLSTSAPTQAATDIETRARVTKNRALLAAGAGSLAALAFTGAAYLWSRNNAGAVDSEEATAALGARGSILVESDPAGAAIWINGDLRHEATPATIGQLPFDRALDVKLTKDGFEEAREAITLTPTATSGHVNVALRGGSVAIDVSVRPDAARPTFTLDGKTLASGTADGLPSGKPHKLVVSAPGYVEQSFAFLGTPRELKHFDVVLERTAETHHHAMLSTVAATKAIVGIGRLNVSAAGGWCNVTIDGAARGPTPLAGVELAAGTHKVTCTPEGGKDVQTTNVAVTEGSTAKYRFTLSP
jgi:eukaryotic-like serine/threonine-protein kinase